jgi:hypothetical protein
MSRRLEARENLRPARIGKSARIALASLIFAGVVVSTTPQGLAETTTPARIDLRDVSKSVLVGGPDVMPAGDVNGDGTRDLLVGDCAANQMAGAVWVVFGPLPSGETDLRDADDMRGRGFRINGTPLEESGSSGGVCTAAAGGDINGDGLHDVLVGANSGDAVGRNAAGVAYVVFGKTDDSVVELQDFDEDAQGAQGFRIDGPGERTYAAGSNQLDGVGDVNRDGLADAAIGAPFAGAVYLVFGRADTRPVDLMMFDLELAAGQGFRIDAPHPADTRGLVVKPAGDTNADGAADVALSITREASIRTYVVFGKQDPTTVDVDQLGSSGYEIVASKAHGGDSAGVSIAPLGDLNGDGASEIALGAPQLTFYDDSGRSTSVGGVYVVFGQTTGDTIRLGQLGDHGYVIRGPTRNRDHWLGFGAEVAGTGDLNGDLVPDVLISAHVASFNSRPYSGSAYLVFGKATPGDVGTRRLQGEGLRFDGPRQRLLMSVNIAGVGDVVAGDRGDIAMSTPRGTRLGHALVFVVNPRL